MINRLFSKKIELNLYFILLFLRKFNPQNFLNIFSMLKNFLKYLYWKILFLTCQYLFFIFYQYIVINYYQFYIYKFFEKKFTYKFRLFKNLFL